MCHLRIKPLNVWLLANCGGNVDGGESPQAIGLCLIGTAKRKLGSYADCWYFQDIYNMRYGVELKKI